MRGFGWRPPFRHLVVPYWRVLVSLLTLGAVTLAQAQPTEAVLRFVTGTVSFEHDDVSETLSANDARLMAVGNALGVGDDGEADLRFGDALDVRVFRSAYLRLESTDDPDSGTAVAYRLSTGTTLNVAAGDALLGRHIEVRTDSATVQTSGGTILVYQDLLGTTWVLAADGTGWVSAAEQLVEVPAGFMTWVAPGGPPTQVVAASRALVSNDFPSVETLTNSALADIDFLVPAPIEVSPTSPPPPAPDPAELRAGNAIVWYWPQPTGPLDTVPQNDMRPVSTGDQVNVSPLGDAVLRFGDALIIRIYRNARIRREASCDPTVPPFFCYRLDAGTVFNTINSEKLGGQRVQVVTNWAIITATGTQFLVYYDRPTGATWLVVTDGTAHVSAGGQDIDVASHFQTVVERAQAPAPPIPATRQDIGERFPLVDNLTNGDLNDVVVLPPVATPTPVMPGGPPGAPSATPTPTQMPGPNVGTSTPTPSPTPTPTPTPTPVGSTAPTIGVDVSPAPSANGWSRADVTITWTVDPGRSGLDSSTGCGVTTVSNETPGTTIRCSVTNRAGGSATRSVTVKLDKTPPQLTMGSPTTNPNAAGWYRADVTIPCSTADALSEVASISPGCPLVLSAEGAAVTGSITVTDNAGNSATLTSSTVKIDKAPPVLTVPDRITANANSAGVAAVSYSASATDNLDPKPALSCTPGSGTQLRIGTTSVTCTATDVADNSASKAFTILVMAPPAPVQVSPPNGSVFNNFPRTTTVKWQAAQTASSYFVEVDCFQCCQTNAWCTDVGRTWSISPKLTNLSYTFDFVGAQPGRWRVWGVNDAGGQGPKSGWWGFSYTR